jgi:hypothetical protein
MEHKKSRSKVTTLRVRFSDGTIITGPNGAEVFARVVQKIGIARVKALGHVVNTMDLVSQEKHPIYNQQRIEGYWIATHNPNERKQALLETIASQLGIGLEVELIERRK